MFDSQISSKLSFLNINFEPSILQALEEHIEVHSAKNLSPPGIVQLCALAAFYLQTREMTTTFGNTVKGAGIPMENIMRHLPALEKELFLKHNYSSSYVLKKVQNVTKCYNLFLRYKAAFKQLSAYTILANKEYEQMFFKIFWVVYLFTKQNIVHKIGEENILYHMLDWVFCEFFPIQYHNSPARDYIISSNFNLSITNHFQLQVKKNIQRLFEDIMRQECGVQSIANTDKTSILNNLHLLDTYLDDLINSYQKKYPPTSQFINQVSFLEHEKRLASFPKPFKVETETFDLIQELIDFRDEEDEEGSQTAEESPCNGHL